MAPKVEMSEDTMSLALDGSRMEMYTVLMLSSLMSDDTGRAESVMGGSSCCCRMGLMMVMRSVVDEEMGAAKARLMRRGLTLPSLLRARLVPTPVWRLLSESLLVSSVMVLTSQSPPPSTSPASASDSSGRLVN